MTELDIRPLDQAELDAASGGFEPLSPPGPGPWNDPFKDLIRYCD